MSKIKSEILDKKFTCVLLDSDCYPDEDFKKTYLLLTKEQVKTVLSWNKKNIEYYNKHTDSAGYS